MAAANQDLLIKIEGLHKRFGENVVLSGASLDVPRGSLVAVLGRSGSGKSVLLKCLAEVIEPDGGGFGLMDTVWAKGIWRRGLTFGGVAVICFRAMRCLTL